MNETIAPVRRSTRISRRAALGAAGGVAAAGAVAAVFGVSALSGDTAGPQASGGPQPAAASAAGRDTIALAKKPLLDTRRWAAHLLRRAGWGGSLADIDTFATLSREQAVDRLLNYATVDNSALDARLARANFNISRVGRLTDSQGPIQLDIQRWWMTRIAWTARPLEERMTYIWHGLLTSQISKVEGGRARLLVIQNELFRANALPTYDTLLFAIGKDPAMLFYLDTVESTAAHPNENYARELMELFSMGIGNYTEEDVREAARAFTGWRVTPLPRPSRSIEGLSQAERQAILDEIQNAWNPQFMVQPRLHDAGQKTFLGQTGTWDGDDIARIILKQPATGRYITRRLFEEFAYPDPDDSVIDRLVSVWDSSGHDVRAVVRAILLSDEFGSEAAYRAKIRAPVEFIAGAVRALELEPNVAQFAAGPDGGGPARGRGRNAFAGMDQLLFEPPSVAGWPGGQTWLSSGTWFARLNVLDQMLFPNGRAAPVPALTTASTPQAMVDGALARLVDDNVPAASREALYAHAAAIPDPRERAANVAYIVLASPEYQLI